MKRLTLMLLAALCVTMAACEKIPVDNPSGDDQDNSVPNGQGGITEDGAVDAFFSVGDTSRVRFSRGNLQYRASTGTWRFAEHQYDIIGALNDNISPTYDGWIDLFGWGTSGWQSGATCCQPFSSTTTIYDYTKNDLTGANANADWGVFNPISNGGNEPGMWRTLTDKEWIYLLKTRVTKPLNGTENARHCSATVHGVHGLILFPDAYVHPQGVPLPDSVNRRRQDTLQNRFSDSQWALMEQAGCVMLPLTGTRFGTKTSHVAETAKYWSSIHDYNEYRARVVHISPKGSFLTTYNQNYYGNPVRLAQDLR